MTKEAAENQRQGRPVGLTQVESPPLQNTLDDHEGKDGNDVTTLLTIRISMTMMTMAMMRLSSR